MDQNKTGTELEILKNIEQAFYRNNPNAKKRLTKRSLDWFRKYIPRAYNRVRKPQMVRDRDMWKEKMRFGRMYLFEYDAKHKDSLPLWDAFPLVFPISEYKAKDGMTIIIGLNMHYLSPQMRQIAFLALLKYKTNDRYNQQTRLKLEWDVLKAMSESKFFKHAIHSYRLDHVRSTFIEIPAQSWEMVLFLPAARWQKGTSKQAYKLK